MGIVTAQEIESRGSLNPSRLTPAGWTEKQLHILHTEWPSGNFTRHLVAQKIGKGFDCCRKKAKQLGIHTRACQFEWPAKLLAEVIRLRAEGVPTREICARTGLTRNAILGKMHRIGNISPCGCGRTRLSAEERKQRARARDAARAALKVSRRPLPSKLVGLPIPNPTVVVPESEWVPFPRNSPRTECAAPMGEGKCCGRQISYGSYCWDHANAFYQIKRVA
jgi:GcrA cell cycle regulator